MLFPLLPLSPSRSGCLQCLCDLGVVGGTHEFEGVLVDEGWDVRWFFAYDFLNERADDGVDLGLKILPNFFTLRFFHKLNIKRKAVPGVNRTFSFK